MGKLTSQPDGPSGPPAGKARKVTIWRVAILALGAAAVIGGLVLWLVPAGQTGSTATQNTTTTVIDSAGHKRTTVVKKNTTTNTPQVGKSDAMLVAVFTFGVGLLAAAGLWDRIQEFAIGGVSIRLTEAVVEEQEIALVDATARGVGYLDSTTAASIAQEVRGMSKDLRLARIDLQAGKPWAPTNLNLYVLLLAYRSSVEVLVFSGQEDSEPGRYFGAASVAWLADRVKATDPDLLAAYCETKEITLTSEADAVHLGTTFWNALGARDNTRVTGPGPDRVDRKRLYDFAGEALISRSIEVDVGQALPRQEQLDILAFPLRYVPITNPHGHLEVILDKRRIAKKMGFSVVDL